MRKLCAVTDSWFIIREQIEQSKLKIFKWLDIFVYFQILLVLFSVEVFAAQQESLTYYRDFWSPRYHGELLNYCLVTQNTCGIEVADKYCVIMGYQKAAKSLIANNVGLTKYLDGCNFCGRSKRICKGWNCNGFKLIRCANNVEHFPVQDYAYRERTYVLPRVEKYRIDWCYENGKGCGKKVANSFCRRMGFARAINYKQDIAVYASREIGDGRLCFGDSCKGFSSVTCYR